MALANDYELGRKYGKTYTFAGVKYMLDEFYEMLDNPITYNDLRDKVILAIEQSNEELENEEEEVQS